MQDAIATENAYGAKNYLPLPVVLTRGLGCYVWDDKGTRYLDMMSAYSAVSHGHCHPRLVAALTAQASTLAIVSRAFYTDRLGKFLKAACDMTGMDMALAMNTGVEAVETAIKAARKWAYECKGVAPGKARIISCSGNFHGRTLAAITMSSEPAYQHNFGPFPDGFEQIPFGDAAALEKAITPSTAAFLVEPIQGEGGVRLPPAGYLADCARICSTHNVLLICDEIQTGLGRTGALLACQHDNVQPDCLLLGKALGGGLLPVSLFLAHRDVMNVFTPGTHGSTFGGNPLAAHVALEALHVLIEEDLISNSARMGQRLIDGLRAIRSPLVREVRGRGLMVGLDIVPPLPARRVCEALMAHGILTKDTHETVVRLAPPLIINAAEIDWAVAQIAATLKSL